MSPISYILPVLTVVSLFLYVFSAERAWLPKAGTTEWITRASTPKRMTADIKFKLSWKDIVIALAIVVVYGAFFSLYHHDQFRYMSPSLLISAVLVVLSVGLTYILANLLFKNRTTAFFAAAMTAANVVDLFGTSYIKEHFCTLLFALFIVIASEHIWTFILAGFALATVVHHVPVTILYTLLALCPAVVTAKKCKNGRSVLLWAIFCFALPVAAVLLRHGTKLSFSLLNFTIMPLYDIVTAVCLVITVIHIFKDKSYTALFISVGLIISIICRAEGFNVMSALTGLAIAYPASIIIQRGKKSHKVFCVIFGSVMMLAFLAAVAYKTLYLYAPHIAEQIVDIFTFVFPFLTY